MDQHIVIVGGGLAGLSAGCYARANGFRATILEHNLALGGVCTAWQRGDYVVDGCIHWLTGGPFMRLYEELGIVPQVELRTIEHMLTWRDAKSGAEVRVTRDLDALARALETIAPGDATEIARIVEGARRFASTTPPGLERPMELTTLRQQVQMFWDMKDSLTTFVHFRKSIATWTREHVRDQTLRRFLSGLVPSEAPALFLLMVFGYLERGYLSRPVGGTARFRDALIAEYERLGGEARTHATVDEILVDDGKASGVRLADGSMIAADAVVSTSSAPETVLRLLGGRFDAADTRHRMEHWKMFQPIVLASFGVDASPAGVPGMLLVDHVEPYEVGGVTSDHLYLRVCNDDASLAPAGHSVIQAMLATDYAWWAKQGSSYNAAKERVAEIALAQIEKVLPGTRDRVRMTDIVTPLTYWSMARSWRGAYEGWMPNADSLFGRVKKTLSGLERFVMAGQWVEPGGGVPTAIMSGRQAIQLLRANEETFAVPVR